MSDILTNPLYDYSKVPPITDERLAELGARIKPVIEQGGKLFYIEDVDPRRTAFTWDPQITTEATGLVRLASIPTRHTFGAPVFFKPSIAEVLAQIPPEYLDDTVAFETLSDNLSPVNVKGMLHLTTTILYRSA